VVIITTRIVDQNRRRSEAEEWYFRLMNDPNQFEKERYIDSINVYSSVIDQLQKLYDQTPASDHFTRTKIVNGMKQSKRELAKTQAEYEVFKKYKTRTARSK
jgi:hypothetical protein